MKSIQGIPASAGLAMGTARYLRHAQSGLGRAVRSPKEEQKAFDEAVHRAQNQLAKLGRSASAQDRDIFMVQSLLLEDATLREEIASYIYVGASAAAAIERSAGIFSRNIRALEDPYMRERACDILDACLRVVQILDDQPHETLHLTGPAILVADELYPTDIAMLDRSLVMGFVTTAGSTDAHAAIIARTMGIPAVVRAGAPEALRECDGLLLALDGDTGEAFLDPDDATRARFAHKLRQLRRHMVSQQHLHTAPCATQDGTQIRLFAVCASPKEVRAAVDMGADGICLQPDGAGMHDEETQYRFYGACMQAACKKPVRARPDLRRAGQRAGGLRYGAARRALLPGAPGAFRNTIARAAARGQRGRFADPAADGIYAGRAGACVGGRGARQTGAAQTGRFVRRNDPPRRLD